MNDTTSSPRLSVLAVSAWLLVLPSALLLGATALRQLQPAQHEPSRAISTILAWIFPRISHTGAAWLFLVLPAVAVIAGGIGIMLAWRKSEALRQDTSAMVACFRRNLAVTILGSGTLLAGAILAAVVIHIITD